MTERYPRTPWHRNLDELADKPLGDMSQDEYVAWYLEYMKTVPEENVMMMSGLPIEIEEDPKAFYDFVTAIQQLKRVGVV
jgi:hypothetical protein